MSTSEIKADVTDLAKVLKGKIKIGDNGHATIEDGTYVSLLPEGIDEAAVKKLQGFHSTLAAATTLATGELAVPYLKKNKDVNVVELSLPMVGKDTLDVTIKREKAGINPSTKEATLTYGAASTGFSVYSTRSRGEMAKVKSHLAELALKSLGG